MPAYMLLTVAVWLRPMGGQQINVYARDSHDILGSIRGFNPFNN